MFDVLPSFEISETLIRLAIFRLFKADKGREKIESNGEY